MEDIRFRAKSLGGYWHYGYYVKIDGDNYIFTGDVEYEEYWDGEEETCTWDDEKIEIDIKTLGQYVGIKDIDGVKIYAGDRCAYEYKDFIIKDGGDTGHLEHDWLSNEGVVTWKDGAFRFELPNGLWIVLFQNRELKVIGTIHDKK